MTTKKSAKKATKKAPAKKAAKKATKKAPAKKAAKKATAKKAAKKAPAKKAAKKATKKAPAKKAPAKKAPAKKAAKKAPAKKAAKKASGPRADRVIKTTSAKKAASAAKKSTSRKKAAAAATPAKPVVRKKKAASAAPKNAGVKPSYLKDKKWLNARRDQLAEERAELAEQVEEFRTQLDVLLETAEAGDDTSSDESSEGTSINVQISELVAERKGRLEHIEMIDEAVARIDAGNYGFCYVDNVAIPKARLEARPESERCVDHKTSMFDNTRR